MEFPVNSLRWRRDNKWGYLFEDGVQDSGKTDACYVELLLHRLVPTINIMISVAVPGGLILVNGGC